MERGCVCWTAGEAGASGAAGVFSQKSPHHPPPNLSAVVVVSSPSLSRPPPHLPAWHTVPFPPSCRGCGLHAARVLPAAPAPRRAPRVLQDQRHGGQELCFHPLVLPGEGPARAGGSLRDGHRPQPCRHSSLCQRFGAAGCAAPGSETHPQAGLLPPVPNRLPSPRGGIKSGRTGGARG